MNQPYNHDPSKSKLIAGVGAFWLSTLHPLSESQRSFHTLLSNKYSKVREDREKMTPFKSPSPQKGGFSMVPSPVPVLAGQGFLVI